MNTIILLVLGGFVALFAVWAVGRISMLKDQLRNGQKFASELAQKSGRLEVEREALQKHCDELRQQFAVMMTRPVITNFSDEQIRQLAQAIFALTNSSTPTVH